MFGMTPPIEKCECRGVIIYITTVEYNGGGSSRSVAERQAVARLIAAHFGDEVEYEHYPSGAPFVRGFEKQYISVSHCLTHAVLAVADRPIGVDAEHWRQQLQRVASRFLQPSETQDCSCNPERLLWYWTAKEAAFKASGQEGLTISNIEIDLVGMCAKTINPRAAFRLDFIERPPMLIALATSDAE